MNRFAGTYTLFLFWSLIGVIFLLSINWAPVSADAPYYLSVSRDIAEGAVPYVDVNCMYTPLMMYLNSWLFRLSGHFNYTYFLLFQYLIIVIAARVLYGIYTLRLHISKEQAMLLAVVFTVAVLSSDGTYIILEPYVVLFTLLSIFFVLKPNKKAIDFSIAGAMLSLSFLSKQHGVLNIIPIGFILFSDLFNKRIKWTGLLLFSFGAIVVIGLFAGYFYLRGIGIIELLHQLGGNAMDYAESGIKTSLSVATYFTGGKVFYILLLPLIGLIIRDSKIIKIPLVFFSLAGMAVFVATTGIRSFQHYFVNSFPYLFFLYGVVVSRGIDLTEKKWLMPVYTIVIFFSVITVYRLYKFKNNKSIQSEIAVTALEKYPAGSSLYIVGNNRFLYVVNNYHNTGKKKVGYSWSVGDVKNYLGAGCPGAMIVSRKAEIPFFALDSMRCNYIIIEKQQKGFK